MDGQTGLALIVMVAGLSFTAAPAAQTYDAYVSGDLGIAMLADAETTYPEPPGTVLDLGFDDDISFSGALGLASGQYRSELEVSYQTNALETLRSSANDINPPDTDLSGNSASLSGLVNVYYDFTTGTPLRPYITAGIGLANIDTSIDIIGFGELSFGGDDIVLAYHLGAGIGLEVSEHVTVDVRYRYLAGQDPRFGPRTSSFLSHNITAGIRVGF